MISVIAHWVFLQKKKWSKLANFDNVQSCGGLCPKERNQDVQGHGYALTHENDCNEFLRRIRTPWNWLDTACSRSDCCDTVKKVHVAHQRK